jgi:hypothetical protein
LGKCDSFWDLLKEVALEFFVFEAMLMKHLGLDLSFFLEPE